MMIDTNCNANYFPYTYHIRSLLTVNGVRQQFFPAVEAYLNNLTAVEAAVLAVLRTETAISRHEIITACREFLLEQTDPGFPTDCSTPPTDDDVALVIVDLVDMGIAELVFIKEEPMPMSSVSVPANPQEREFLEQEAQEKPAITYRATEILFASEAAFADTTQNWLQRLYFPWEKHVEQQPIRPVQTKRIH